MSNIFVIKPSGRMNSKSLPPRNLKAPQLKKPSPLQLLRLAEILPVVRGLSGLSLDDKRQALAKHGYDITSRRIPRLCSIGSYYWYPRLGLFRVVVASPRIDRRRLSFPYADCIQILV